MLNIIFNLVDYLAMENLIKVLLKEIVVVNEFGFHARPAAKIAKLAQDAKASVWIIKEDIKVDASSIIDILTLTCSKGTKITLKIDNPSDIKILNSITKLIETGFGE